MIPDVVNPLTNTEAQLINSIWDDEIQQVIGDIVHCKYATLRRQFTMKQSKAMEQILGPNVFPLPPPPEAWAERHVKHYKKDIVFNKMCELMEERPVLRSCDINRIISKFQIANQIPHPAPQQENLPQL
jgi:hypothetical protein